MPERWTLALASILSSVSVLPMCSQPSGRSAPGAVRHPLVALQHQIELASQILRGLTGGSNIEPPRGDRRFADPVWTSSPIYRAIQQCYLASRDALDRWVGQAGFDRVNEQRARIALSQLGDALAPTNTLLGNPAAMRQCFETGGASTLQGLRRILDDWAQNGGLPAQVDKRPFRVGDNLGATDGAVIFRNDQAELIQYTPRTGQVLSRPLLIVPPQINKFYLFDLASGRSLIEYLLANGIQVFVVSWRNPTADRRDWGLDSYVSTLVELTDVVRSITKSQDLNLVAACSGGITASAMLGHLSARGAADQYGDASCDSARYVDRIAAQPDDHARGNRSRACGIAAPRRSGRR